MNVQPILSIIIVNYRSANYTKGCLESIYQNAPGCSIEIIVVDNASNDGCAEMIQAGFPHVNFVQSDRNLGFAGANNLGISVARGSYLLFLNPDTEVRPHALQALIDAMLGCADAGMVGGHLLNSDLTVQTTSITAFPSILNQILGTEYLRRRFPKAKMWGIRPLFEVQSQPVPVDAISGACMCANRKVIDQVGGFTTDYFMYAEDLDLCLKVRQSGWKIYYAPEAVIVHHGGKSSDARSEANYADLMIKRSIYQFLQRHSGQTRALCFRFATAVVSVFRICLLVLAGSSTVIGPKRRSRFRGAAKWARILSWSLGIPSWVERESSSARPGYDPQSPKTTPVS